MPCFTKCVHITYPKHLKNPHVIAEKKTDSKSTLYQRHTHTHTHILTHKAFFHCRLPYSFFQKQDHKTRDLSCRKKTPPAMPHTKNVYCILPPSMFVIYNPSMMIYLYLAAISLSHECNLSLIIPVIVVIYGNNYHLKSIYCAYSNKRSLFTLYNSTQSMAIWTIDPPFLLCPCCATGRHHNHQHPKTNTTVIMRLSHKERDYLSIYTSSTLPIHSIHMSVPVLQPCFTQSRHSISADTCHWILPI